MKKSQKYKLYNKLFEKFLYKENLYGTFVAEYNVNRNNYKEYFIDYVKRQLMSNNEEHLIDDAIDWVNPKIMDLFDWIDINAKWKEICKQVKQKIQKL